MSEILAFALQIYSPLLSKDLLFPLNTFLSEQIIRTHKRMVYKAKFCRKKKIPELQHGHKMILSRKTISLFLLPPKESFPLLLF